MRLMLALVWVTLTTASTLHYTPTKVLLDKLQSASDALDKRDQAPANTQYHEQDSDGFYSYGYSAGRSAKAEYITLDGSSHGFYSYVDADGKLQTVKYEAGRKQGFKASATNLPKAPKNPNRFGPSPVRDTPEVQEAKKAHFEAYREAELREAIEASQNEARRYEKEDAEAEAEQQQEEEAKKAHFEAYSAADLRDAITASQNEATRYEEDSAAEAEKQQQQQKSELGQQEVADILENTRSKILAILSEGASATQGAASAESTDDGNTNAGGASREQLHLDTQQEHQEDVESADDYENGSLLPLANLQITNDGSTEGGTEEAENASSDGGDNITFENAAEQNEASNSAGGARASSEFSASGESQISAYKLSDILNSDDQFNTHALYTFESDDDGGESSKDLLRLSELQAKSDLSLAQRQQLASVETVRVPVHSYYTVLAPSNKYTVVTPTTHKLVARQESLKRGHSLPISISSSYISHRL